MAPEQGHTIAATQLYGWTQEINFPGQPPFLERVDEAFAAIKRAGFENVEGMLGWHEDRRFLEALERHDLDCPALYCGGTFHIEEQADKTIADLLSQAAAAVDALGISVLNCNPNPKPDGSTKTDEELATQARALDVLGGELLSHGVRLALHNHTPAMRQGAREVHSNLRNTSPGKVWLNADVEWIHHGGGDPLAILEEYGDRTASLHLRDAVGTTWVQALGEGEIDFQAIAEVLRRKGFTGVISLELATAPETQRTRTFEENHRLSRQFIREVFRV